MFCPPPSWQDKPPSPSPPVSRSVPLSCMFRRLMSPAPSVRVPPHPAASIPSSSAFRFFSSIWFLLFLFFFVYLTRAKGSSLTSFSSSSNSSTCFTAESFLEK